MGVIQRIKNWWNKGGNNLMAMFQNETYEHILDHPKINFDQSELRRIEQTFKHYKGDYPDVSYLNTKRERRNRPYKSINMTKIVAEHLATLVFNEQCKINIGSAEEETGEYPDTPEAEFVKEILERNDFKKNLSKYLEPTYATGGLVVRPYYDAGSKQIEFSWCLADAFIPLRNNTNSISEGCIPTYTTLVTDGVTHHYTLLEFHEWIDDLYVISNELYKSSEKDRLGTRVPLSDLKAYADLEPITPIEGLSRPLFSYFKPSGFNNINPHSPLGLGLLDNSRSTVTAINDTYDEFNWEIKDGKRRMIISDHFLKSAEIGESRPQQVFDDQSSAFIALPGKIDEMIYKDLTHNIRSSQYIESINKLFQTLEMEVGLSTNTFTYQADSGVTTATEVVSKDSKTFRTRNKHVAELRDSIRDLIISTFELAKFVKVDGKALYSGNIPSRDEIGIDFDDGVFNDKQSELDFLSTAKLNNFIPEIEAIQRLFDVPLATAKEWQEMIKKDRLDAMPDMQQAMSESSMLGAEE